MIKNSIIYRITDKKLSLDFKKLKSLITVIIKYIKYLNKNINRKIFIALTIFEFLNGIKNCKLQNWANNFYLQWDKNSFSHNSSRVFIWQLIAEKWLNLKSDDYVSPYTEAKRVFRVNI